MDTISFENRNFKINEAATHLRVGRTGIYRLIREGKLQSFKIGSRTIITGAELARFAAKAEAEAATL